jgi:hypothetical protein
MLETGIYPSGQGSTLRAQCIEVFQANANAFPDDIEQAHQMLVPDAAVPQIANGGVLIHAGVSSMVSPGSLVDVYGTGLARRTSLRARRFGAADHPGGCAGSGERNACAADLREPDDRHLSAALRNGIGNRTGGGRLEQYRERRRAGDCAAVRTLTYDSNRAVVLNQDYSVNGPANPAKVGSTPMAYLIGGRPLDVAIATGAVASTTTLSRETLPFAGTAPGFVGLVQVNFTIPNLPTNDYPLQVKIGSAASNQPLLAVAQ